MYYSPEFGRFIHPANILSLNSSSINRLNLYSFINNNPIWIAYSNSSIGGIAAGEIKLVKINSVVMNNHAVSFIRFYYF
jgi:hypothetical protein